MNDTELAQAINAKYDNRFFNEFHDSVQDFIRDYPLDVFTFVEDTIHEFDNTLLFIVDQTAMKTEVVVLRGIHNIAATIAILDTLHDSQMQSLAEKNQALNTGIESEPGIITDLSGNEIKFPL